jgi:isopentenyl diphosphate isomerase/L-lactate dehydrogenase-like FMN-dependent dehydrogenase
MPNRRAFLHFVAGSPLLAAAPSIAEAFQAGGIQQAADALDVFDFQAAAEKIVPPAHWGYLMTGVDGEDTLKANREGFSRYQLRPKRFVDVSKIDMSVELFGMKYNSPIALCPVGSQRAFHRDGEVGAARAAQAKGHLQILSTQTSFGVEDVTKARGGPIWYQLYTTDNFEVTTKLVKRAEAAGCTAVAVTVDLPAGRNTLTMTRGQRADTRACGSCHEDATGNLANPRVGGGANANKPMFAGINTQGLGLTSPSLTWTFIKRLKDVTKMKVVIKGLETGEDAALAVTSGADGIIISNHGGRATETGRGTIECVAEVAQSVRGRIPILVDGGFRRGTDVFKALALGANAVGIGRPYIWGLSAFGQQGVERVLDILNNELRLAMVGCGTRSVKEITATSIVGRK